MDTQYTGLPFDFRLSSDVIIDDYAGFDQTSLLFMKYIASGKHREEHGVMKIQQFTGILDRNNKKIYFGDTLRFADKIEWF